MDSSSMMARSIPVGSSCGLARSVHMGSSCSRARSRCMGFPTLVARSNLVGFFPTHGSLQGCGFLVCIGSLAEYGPLDHPGSRISPAGDELTGSIFLHPVMPARALVRRLDRVRIRGQLPVLVPRRRKRHQRFLGRDQRDPAALAFVGAIRADHLSSFWAWCASLRTRSTTWPFSSPAPSQIEEISLIQS